MIVQGRTGLIELSDDETQVIAVHKVRFHQAGGLVVKEDLDTGVKTIVPEKRLLTIDSATGVIEGEQSGFVTDLELGYLPEQPGKTVVFIEALADFMADVILPDGNQVKKIAYKWDGTKLKKKTKAEMEQIHG